jgi:preprotein translocase subunit SecE
MSDLNNKPAGTALAAAEMHTPMADESISASRYEPPSPPESPRAAGGSPFAVYKPGQGLHVRWGTAGGLGLIALAAAAFIYDQLPRINSSTVVQTTVPVVILAGLAYFIFWLVGQKHNFVDFLIATEGEMKKVNWSTRAEVIGATRIVIVTLLALGFLLAFVDALFIVFFSKINVLKIDAWHAIFGGLAGSAG